MAKTGYRGGVTHVQAPGKAATKQQQARSAPLPKHVCLNAKELEEFRTKQCPMYSKGTCADSVRCNMSHSETWPRRNPSVFRYDYKLCPNIQFFRQDNKMQLKGKCHHGRRCRFSHSKEEQLYHPDLYKTRMCLNFPNCKGYFCPFAHSKAELRTRKVYGEVANGDKQPAASKKGEKQPVPPAMQEPAQPILLNETYFAEAEPMMRELQTQMINDAIQSLCDGEYHKADRGLLEVTSLNSTIGSPLTLSTQDMYGVIDFELSTHLDETLRLHDDEEHNLRVLNAYLAKRASKENESVSRRPLEGKPEQEQPETGAYERRETQSAEDEEGDGWLDAVLQKGLKLLSEDAPASAEAENTTAHTRLPQGQGTQEMCAHHSKLAQSWWM
ncbi:zinc finger domain containing protein, putative [Babesia caballi]|uniref:Zinc finger domain containing protein, putative n=1 Tax=Babesia caballi TaxID=5871 RepID=A0AAV4LUU3_BABCB|nr:zinc finger domain containing protein, putative [Babesia caballi]